MIRLTKKEFKTGLKKSGHISYRGGSETIALSDGTKMIIRIDVSFFPGEIIWYVYINTHDLGKHRSGAWHSQKKSLLLSNAWVKRFVNLAQARANSLATLPYRQRDRVIKSWLKRALTNSLK